MSESGSVFLPFSRREDLGIFRSGKGRHYPSGEDLLVLSNQPQFNEKGTMITPWPVLEKLHSTLVDILSGKGVMRSA